MSQQYKIGFIGAGVMATAILKGIIKKGLFHPEEMIVSNRSMDKLEQLKKQYSIAVTTNNQEVFEHAEIVIIAVKPQQFASMASQLEGKATTKQMIVSIMAGITMECMAEYFGQTALFRAMPNTPGQVNVGMTGLCHNQYVLDEGQIAVVKGIFDSVGETIIVQENMMDAVGAISGSGPAYMFQIIEALADGGVLVGLPRNIAYQLVAQTMRGAATMVLETNAHPAVLKDQVTSPAGTTIRGLEVMEQAGMRGTLIEAVEQAYLQSKKLGEK